jgi:hypothetical protein
LARSSGFDLMKDPFCAVPFGFFRVILGSEWPRRTWAAFTSTPPTTRVVAFNRRRSWNPANSILRGLRVHHAAIKVFARRLRLGHLGYSGVAIYRVSFG